MSYTLHQGDCLEVLKRLPEASIDALISDPPYGTTDLAWDIAVDWPAFWEQAHRICKPQAVIVLFSAQPFTTDLINSNRKAFRYELIWHKTRSVGWLSANRRPLRAHENILIFAHRFAGSTYNPQKEGGFRPYRSVHQRIAPHYGKGSHGKGTPQISVSESLDGTRHPRSVLLFAGREPGTFRHVHPTQKPLALMQWLVRTYSQMGQTVLDPFMGSGSTGVACLMNDRHFIGIERESPYFGLAQARLEQTTLQQTQALDAAGI